MSLQVLVFSCINPLLESSPRFRTSIFLHKTKKLITSVETTTHSICTNKPTTTMQYPTPYTQRALSLSTETPLIEKQVLNVPSRVSPRTTTTNSSTTILPLPLPVEIITTILKHLDLRTLGRIRQINRGLAHAVDTETPYQTLLARVPDTLQALADTKTIQYFSISHLDSAIRSPLCALCGAVGTLFYIPLATRICGYCLEHDEDARVLPTCALDALFDIPEWELENSGLTTIHTVAGKYGDGDANADSDAVIESHALLRLSDVFRFIQTYYPSEAAFEAAAAASLKKRLERYTRHLAAAITNPSHPPPSKPLPWRRSLSRIGNRPNLLCTVPLRAFLDLSAGTRIPVRFCVGCLAEKIECDARMGDPAAVNHEETVKAHARRAGWAWVPEGLNAHVLECGGCRKVEGKEYFFLKGEGKGG